MMMRIAIVCVLALTACDWINNTERNPAYCDENTPCDWPGHPERSFCDLLGEYPESEGIRQTCIEPPEIPCESSDVCVVATMPVCNTTGECVACTEDAAGDAACLDKDAASPVCVGGACVGCRESASCGAAAPICDDSTQECRACTDNSAGDAECTAKDGGTPRCVSGGCVECVMSADCMVATAPICETATNTCRGCVAHAECSSEVCGADGGCVAETDIIYVDGGAGADGTSCGSMTSPCATIGGAQGGLAKVTAMRDTIKVRSGTYVESVTVGAGQTVIIVGPATIAPPTLSDTPGFLVNGGSDVTINDLTITSANGGTNADGVRCSSASVSLLRATVSGNEATGVQATDCTVTVEGSTIHNNQGGGVSISNSGFTLRNNFITSNGDVGAGGTPFGGVTISNAATPTQILEFNTITDNKANAAFSPGVICAVITPTTASNDIVWANLGGGSQLSGTCTWRYSDIEGGQAGTGNINMDPLFVDALNGDFHLMTSSPCRDKADPAATITVDIDGDARPQGSRSDMGADEVVP